MFEVFGVFWIFFGVIAFIIIVTVFGGVISALKNANTTTPPPIDNTYYPIDDIMQIDKVKPEEFKSETKTCSYCGSKVGVNETKCSSCGAEIKNK